MRTHDIQWAIDAGLRVSAVAGRDPARAARFVRETGIPHSHGSRQALVMRALDEIRDRVGTRAAPAPMAGKR